MAQVPVRFKIEGAPVDKTVPVRFVVEEALSVNAPPAPATINGTAKPSQVIWFWAPVAGDIVGYELQTRTSTTAWATVYSGDDTSFTETDVPNGTTRQARSRAIADDGGDGLIGEWSGVVARTPEATVGGTGGTTSPPPVTTTPTELSASLNKVFIDVAGPVGGDPDEGTDPDDPDAPPVIIQPGSVSGQQFGVPYTLIGPDGTRVVWNNPADPDNIGMISEITGLDSADVRESADDLVEADGGVHGDFYYGRRPITISGIILPRSKEHRNYCLTRLARATNALRKDAQLMWTPDGGIEQTVSVRRQVPNRTPGGWVKQFQIGLVSADHRIYSTVYNQAQVAASPWTVAPQNRGIEDTPPVITLYGPMVNPLIQNFTTGEIIKLDITIAAGDFIVIDTRSATVLLNNSESRYSAVDFIATDWWMLEPGLNDVRLSTSSVGTGASLTLQWRDAWV